MTDGDPALARAQATATDVLDLQRLTLIGLISTAAGPAALIRSAQGEIARIEPGARVLGVTVTAIGDAGVLLTGADGVTTALHLPGAR